MYAFVIVNGDRTMSKMITANESASIDFRTRMHREKCRVTTVRTKSTGSVGRRMQTFTNAEPIHQPSPRTDRKPVGGTTVGIGYDVERVRILDGTAERIVEYHWGLLIGFGLNAWQSTPCPIKYNSRSQAEAVASSLFEEEKIPRIVGRCLRRPVPRVLWQAFASVSAD